VAPALAILAAGARIVPGWALVALAAGFAASLDLASRAACGAAFGLALLRAGRQAGADAWTRVLAAAAAPRRAARLGVARWQRGGAFAAFLRKDALLVRRPGPARARLMAPLFLGALALLVWRAPIAPSATATVALALTLLAAAGVAVWIVGLAASDPFPVVRGLPLGVGVVWGARVVWAAVAALTLATGQALAAGTAPAPVPPAPVAAIALTVLAIGTLGANYAITLFPRAEHAERILAIALSVSLAASLMIYFLGWILLLFALLHSARRLRRWAWQEAA
jgi:hypothetical protein